LPEPAAPCLATASPGAARCRGHRITQPSWCLILANHPLKESALDLLSTIVSELGLRVSEPRVATLQGSWALSLPTGAAWVHLLRHGRCLVWPASAQRPFSVARGSAVLVSGGVECTMQFRGPRLAPVESYDGASGSSLDHVAHLPKGDGVQIISARVDLIGRPGRLAHRLPPLVVLRPYQLPLPGFLDPLVETLISESFHPRPGVKEIVRRLLEVFIIQGLRAHLIDAFWTAPGHLGVLSDPVLRTGLHESDGASLPLSVEALASEVHRSARRGRSRVKASAGESPGRLLRRSRMQRALRSLERGEPRLAAIAHELGYADVSCFCRAFRREVGCTPTEYWRRMTGRPFPRVSGTDSRTRRLDT